MAAKKATQDMDMQEFQVFLHEEFATLPRASSETSEPLESDFSNDSYNFAHKNRGLAIVFNNENFKKSKDGVDLKKRSGSSVDVSSLKKSFCLLGFHVKVFDDLKSDQILKTAETAATLYNHADADCFVCVILTHGEEIVVSQNKGIRSIQPILFGFELKSVLTDDIVEYFSDENCPSLVNKPRLFFIQACRGDRLDDGVPSPSGSNPEAAEASSGNERVLPPQDDIQVRPVILKRDFLIAYATPPGYSAFRNTDNGSWFIQELCIMLKSEELENISFLRMLTSVVRQVALEYKTQNDIKNKNGKKTTPVLDSMLIKDIFFTRK